MSRSKNGRGVIRLLAAAAVVAAATPACVAAGASDTDPQAAKTIDVRLSEFVIEPSSLDAEAGRPVRLSISNEGSAPHTFAVVTEARTFETPTIAPGDTATLDVPALDAGSYEVKCTVPGHDNLGMTATLSVGGGGSGGARASSEPGMTHGTMTAEEMAAAHRAGVEAFLAGGQTDTSGNRPLEPVIRNGVKVFELDMTHTFWEVSKGIVKQALSYNGQIPGPELRVRPGDHVRVILNNHTDQPTAVHFHGLTLPNAMDGVPYVTQPPIMPGESFTYEFTVQDPPGMYVYHSHFNSTEQVGSGLYGAFIVEPRDGRWRSVYGVEPAEEYDLFLGDGPLGFVLNGKSFPATSPLVAARDDWVLIHLANDGELLHPMHLHGFHFLVVGEDGFPLSPSNRYHADTLVVAPGSRFDILVKADQPGAWAFHCHILSHVEGPEGMYGMVTALVVR
ncbi:MAG TPA: multicopper oxidase domain-containing protein [Actinomycetota bacterium]|nr:multicopper oxidase domain-containing protein [Actinomycetota bacterium]